MTRAIRAILVLLLFVSACSLGPREQWVESIRGGLEAADEEETAKVRQFMAVEPIETNIRQTPQALIPLSSGTVDFGERRARMVEPTGRKVTVVYDDLDTYVIRSPGSVGARGKRWAVYDYVREPSSAIDDNDRRLSVGAGLISPVIALELLEGVLTGSIERAGEENKTGVRTTRYTARLAPDAAVNDIDDEDRAEGVQRIFEILGVQQDDFPVDVWLDAEERVRGIRFVMRQQKDRVNAFELRVSWEFFDFGSPVRLEVPPADDVQRSGRFRDFVEEVIRRFD